jgi:HD-GYP domain-containing protein (c-di-GMP phosphodiesterase class II)
MRHLGQLHGFLSSLSSLIPLNFQIWDAKELVYASDNGAQVSNLTEHQAFADRITNRAAYQSSSHNGGAPMFGMPIKYGQEVIASLIVSGSNDHHGLLSKDSVHVKTYDAKQMEPFLTHLAGLAEETWANRKEIEEMSEELSQSFEDLSLHARISTHMRSLQFSEEMLKALVEELQETMRVDLAFIEMPDRQGYNAIVSSRALSDRVANQQAFIGKLIQSIPKEAPSLEQDYFIVNNAANTPGFRELHSDPYRFLAVKVAHDATFDGWLGLVSFKLEEHFRQSELRLLQSMAKHISVLLANVDLYHDLERFVINMVKSLVFAIEAKDIYTRGHSERVNRYAMLIAERLQLDKADILEPLEQLASCLPSILHHHERVDGKGYPHGLKGEEIPFLARIIAVADTFDAITSNRAYRSAKAAEKALAIVENVAGTQLDPKVVEAFKEVYETTLKAEFKTSHDE